MADDDEPDEEPSKEGSEGGERIVLVDSNALMMQFQFHVDLEQELQRVMPGAFEVIVPDIVVEELERKAEQESGKTAEEARLAIELAETFDVVEAEADTDDVDDAIVQMAAGIDNSVVVTNDKLLRAQLRAQGIPNVHMRSKAFLTVEGFPGF